MRIPLLLLLCCLACILSAQSLPPDTNQVKNIPQTNWFYIHRNKLLKLSDSLEILSSKRTIIKIQKIYINYLENTLDTCKQDLTITSNALSNTDTSLTTCSTTLKTTNNKLLKAQKGIKVYRTLFIGTGIAFITYILAIQFTK